MFADYDYDPADGISYPLDYQPPGEDGFLLRKKGIINPIYPESLVSLCKSTEVDLNRLKDQLVQFDPCYAYDMKHWHKAQRKYESLFNDDYSPDRKPKWKSSNSFFVDAQMMQLKGWRSDIPHDELADYKDGPKEYRICYLCSTLDEHQQHLARRGPQLKPKVKRKPRIRYIPPPPTVKKKEEKVIEKQEVLYKITVKTGNNPQAGTSANVSISLKGKKGWMTKKLLKKKLAVNFCFGPGTSEMFYIKGPNIGELLWVIIEHDGLEKKHSWFLEEVQIMNMKTCETFVFVCKQWLSLYIGDYSIKKQLKAQSVEDSEMEYEVQVFTAKERMAGTDANVFITFYGKNGVSPKLQLRNKSKNNFERGSEDVFKVTTKNIGPLSNIRLEHDNTGAFPGWLVEKVIVQELDDPGRSYVFPCGQWFDRSEGDGKTCRTLYPLKDKQHTHGKGKKDEDLENQIFYEFDITTGKKKYAGTDATVYIKLYGKTGVSHELEFRDENGRRFERGKIDHFRVRGDDVGDIKKIIIRHNNKGIAAGWFCKQVVVKRFFSKKEIMERLSEMEEKLDQSMLRRLSEITGNDFDISSQRQSLKSRSKDDYRDRHSNQRRPSSASSRGRTSMGSLECIDEEEIRKPRKKSSKKITHNNIKHHVTDSEEDEEYNDSRLHQRRGRNSKKPGRVNYSSYEEDSDEEDNRYHQKVRYYEDVDDEFRRRSRRRSSSSSDSSDSEQIEQIYTTYAKDRIPYCDEYVFQCEQWLADDEGDCQIMKILKPKSITTFYKVINVN